ncbi:MAG: hypothetical protein SH850_16400 [Planctomycetaceae bacterium]|nr:hypothetical protein [Planctomycetaceae bacterium]
MSREDVIRQIVDRDLQGRAMSEHSIQRDDSPLLVAAVHHYGSWELALGYAGVSPRRARSRPTDTAQEVCRMIYKLCISGYGLKPSHLVRSNRRVYLAALRHFGTWKNALRATGIDPKRALYRQPRRLDRLAVLEAIQERQRAGLSLVWSVICCQDRRCAMSAKHAFGSWRKAMIAAGVPPENYRHERQQRWNKQRVLDSLRHRQQARQTLSQRMVHLEFPTLIVAARRYFGSWRNALDASNTETECGTLLTENRSE